MLVFKRDFRSQFDYGRVLVKGERIKSVIVFDSSTRDGFLVQDFRIDMSL